MKQYMSILLITLGLAGCGSDPVEVSINERDDIDSSSYYRSILSIRAIEDSVVIKNIVINRGNNCKVGFWHNGWAGHGTLKFGNGVSASIPCDMEAVKEVEVATDKGNFAFSF